MSNEIESTTRLNVDISQFKAGIQEANRQIRLANAEFKAASSGMDDWAKSTDGLNAKINQLEKVLDSENSKLDNLKQQLELVVQEQGENSRGADELRIAIANQQAAVNKTQKSLNDYKNRLDEVESAQEQSADSAEEAVSAYDKLANEIDLQERNLKDLKKTYASVVLEQGDASAEARDLARQINNLSNDLKDNKNAMDKVDRAADNLDDSLEQVEQSAKEAGDGFTILKGAMATWVADAVKSVGSSIVNIANDTREYRSEMAKLETAFTSNGLSASTATKVYKDFYAVLGDEGQAVEAVNHLSLMTNNEKDLAKWTNIATGVFGQFGASLPIEGLTEAANETAKVGQVTGPLADALNWTSLSAADLGLKLKANTEENEEWNKAIKEGASSEDLFNMALSECTTEQERQALIMNTLNGLYSDSATKFKENNKDIIASNQANSDLTDTMAKLGEKAEPVITTLKEGFNKLLSACLELVEDVDMQAFTDGISAGFDLLVDSIPVVVDGVKSFVNGVEEATPIIATLGTVIGGLALAGVVQNFGAIVAGLKAWALTTPLVTAAQWLLNAAMNANPISLIVIAIAALVAGFVVLWNKSETFRQFWMDLWEKIKEGCGVAIDWIGEALDGLGKFFTETIPEFFGQCIDWIKENWPNILLWLISPFAGLFKYFYDNNKKFREFVDNAINEIKELPGKAEKWLNDTINKVSAWASKMIKKATDTGTKFVNSVVNFFVQLPGKIWTYLTNVVSKVVSWGSDMVSKGQKAIRDFYDTIVNKIKEIPKGIASVGSDIVKGLWNGINDMSGWISGKIKGFGDDVLGGIKDFFGINSPSKVLRDEVGKFLPEGMAVGINANADSVYKAMKHVNKNTLNMAKSNLKDLNNYSPSKLVRSASQAMKKNMPTANNRNVPTNHNVTNNYNFTQNNTSPKALSRLELYRQTKNQLNFAKGV